jgi:hypothetical protein
MNRHWKAWKLEPLIEEKICEAISSPQMADEIAARKPKVKVVYKTVGINKRLCEIDKEMQNS